MLFLPLIISTAVTSFSISNTNNSNYDLHYTFISSWGTCEIVNTNKVNDDQYVSIITMTSYGDLYFNETPNNDTFGHTWCFSISRIQYACSTYLLNNADPDLYYTALGSCYSNYYASDYDVANPTSNLIWDASDSILQNTDNRPTAGSLRHSLYIEPEFEEFYWTLDFHNPAIGYNNYYISDDWVSVPFNFSGDYEDYISYGCSASTQIIPFIGDIQDLFSSYGSSNAGYNVGYETGYDIGYNTGYNQGYSGGFTDGLNTAIDSNSTALTIFNGILNIALVPINFFLGIFNWEIFGINLSQFVSALLSIACLVILLRVVFNGGSKK